MKKTIYLTEGDIRKIVSEALAAWMKPKQVKIDNFSLIASKMDDLTGTDEFYFVQVIKRKKDNPNANFNYAQYYGYWKVKNSTELMKIKPQAEQLSKQHNARIYIRMNPRNEIKSNQHAQQFIHTRKPTQLEMDIAFQKAAGWRFDSRRFTQDFPATMVDIDSTDTKIHNDVLNDLKQNNIPIWFYYTTPNGGLHIMCKTRDVMNIDFSKYDNGQHLGRLATVGADIDAATLLYCDIVVVGYKK